MKDILFFTDAGGVLGIGHVMRCLALAEYFAGRDCNCTFSCDQLPAYLATIIQEAGHEIHDRASPEFLNEAEEKQFSGRFAAVVIDGYHFSHEFRLAAKALGGTLLCFDDLCDPLTFSADIIVNPWPYALDMAYPEGTALNILAGGQYFPFRQAIIEAANAPARPLDERQSIVVTLGGTDPIGLTANLAGELKRRLSADVRLQVIISKAHENAGNLRHICGDLDIQLLVSPPNFSQLLKEAGLAICAGGGTSAELALMGTPALMAIIADNQEINAQSAWCPAIEGRAPRSAEFLAIEAVRLWNEPDLREGIATAGKTLFDGRGCARIYDALFPTPRSTS